MNRATKDELLAVEALSSLRDDKRMSHVGLRRMPSLLRDTSRTKRTKSGSDIGGINRLEGMTRSGSLRIEMTNRVRLLLQADGLPMKVDDIHAIATKGLQEFVETEIAKAYLTNSVAWALASLVRAGEIDKLDEHGNTLRDLNGKIIRRRAHYYRKSRPNLDLCNDN